MSDVHKLLERGVGGATPPPDGFERMLRRHDRKPFGPRGVKILVAHIAEAFPA